MRSSLVALLVGLVGGCQAAGVPIAGDPEGPPIDGKAVCLPANGAWTNDVIDTLGTQQSEIGPLGSTTSLAARADGMAAIAYGDVTARNFLVLALRPPASAWTKQPLDSFGQETDAGDGAVVRFDGAGRPVVAVARRADYPSRVEVRLGDGTVTQIDVTGATVYDVALALDGADRPHVAFARNDTGLFYASWDGAAWQLEHIADGTVIGQSLAFGGDGRPWVLYQSHDQEWVELARRGDDGAWSIETVATSSAAPLHFTTLAIDAHGRPHVTYVDWKNLKEPHLTYAVRGDAGWQIEPVECAGAVQGATMVLDAANRPHVAFSPLDRMGDPFTPTFVTAPLRYAVRAPDGWEIETVGGAGEADEWPSLVVGSDGAARASWFDMFTGTVRYGERTP